MPTLSSGFRETVAEKLEMTAEARFGAASPCSAVSAVCTAGAVAGAGFMLRFKARFFAADNAGNKRAAMTAMTAMTTRSSISVKACARVQVFIKHQLSICAVGGAGFGPLL